jgi:DNA-binding CsgD family transcriptional regulator
MNAHTGTLKKVEARSTIADRQQVRPQSPVREPFDSAERRSPAGMSPDTASSLEQWGAVLRAPTRTEDVERLRVDAELAFEWLARGSCFRSAALHVLEVAHFLADNGDSLDGTAAQVSERSDGEDLEAIRFRMRLAASLTPAELRLLPLLTTHLSLGEIAKRLSISRSTVKTEVISAYRKLLASSRSEAVENAVELGLIETTAATGAAGLIRNPAVTREQLNQLTFAVVAIVGGGL